MSIVSPLFAPGFHRVINMTITKAPTYRINGAFLE
jgi:hypothetical protein